MSGLAASADSHHGESLRRFLREHPPFDRMMDADLNFLLKQGELVFYAAGTELLNPQGGPVQHFYAVYQGRIQGLRDTEVQFDIGVGECFPLAALMGERPTRTAHVAVVDSFCLRWTREDFARLVRDSEPFRDFALKGVSGLLAEVGKQLQQRVAGQLGSDFSLSQPVGDLLHRQPVVAVVAHTLTQVIAAMDKEQVSSVVIVDAQRYPLGIFTLRDLRRRLAHEGWQPDIPISAWMTPRPISIEHDVPVFQAALLMAEKGITHIVVTHHGRLQGVLAERDVFQLQRLNLVSLTRDIRYAEDIEQLQRSREAMARLVDQLLARGASAEQITQLIARLNDQLVQRVMRLVSQQHGEPVVPVTWLCFGSEAREEQTLHTDQDNGLWFEATPDEAEGLREQLMPWASEVNRQLDALGLVWCKGGIMAGQPKCCLSVQEWRQRFARIIQEPTPQKLLDAVIFLDMRALEGDLVGVEALRQELFGWVQQNGLFRRLLTEDALRRRPPLGHFRDFRVTRGGEHPNTFDIKTEAIGPMVDATRVLALTCGVSEVSTTARLRALATLENGLRPVDAAAYEEACQHLQLLRLQLHREQQRAGLPLSNRLDPDALNPLDRRILRECLRQLQRLQRDIALRVGL